MYSYTVISKTPAPKYAKMHDPTLINGTVSPDIGLHFSFWKIKLVLSAGPLMVLTFFYFAVPEIFK
jgi:hypothetical protein